MNPSGSFPSLSNLAAALPQVGTLPMGEPSRLPGLPPAAGMFTLPQALPAALPSQLPGTIPPMAFAQMSAQEAGQILGPRQASQAPTAPLPAQATGLGVGLRPYQLPPQAQSAAPAPTIPLVSPQRQPEAPLISPSLAANFPPTLQQFQPGQMPTGPGQVYAVAQGAAASGPIYPGATVLVQTPQLRVLRLEPEQVPHYQKYATKLIPDTRLQYWFDTSEAGTGKTYIAGAIAVAMAAPLRQAGIDIRNIPLLWIAPKMVVSKVREFFVEYGLRNYGAFSYSELTGKAVKGGFSQPKHGMLERVLDQPTGKKKAVPIYRATPAFIQIVGNVPGVILVVDESHSVKNKGTARSAAVAALSRAVLSSAYGYVAMLSATPLDKEKHADAYMRVLGITTKDKSSYKTPQGGFKLGSALEAITFAYRVNPQATTAILAKHDARPIVQPDGTLDVLWDKPGTDVAAKKIMYLVFKDIIYGQRFSRMIMPKRAVVKNLFLYYSEPALKLIDATVLQVVAATGYVPGVGIQGKMKKGTNIGKYIKELNDALASRIPDWLVGHLTANPTRKAVDFTKSVEAANWMSYMLQNWSPLLHTGETKSEVRQEMVKTFLQPNLDRRIFIGTTGTGGVGIDLDDKFGEFPRTVVITPDYSYVDYIQALSRVRRMSTKSVPWMYTVYPINYKGTKITDLMTALIEKSEVVRDFTDGGDRADLTQLYGSDIKYPNEYESEFEAAPPQDGQIYPPRTIADK